MSKHTAPQGKSSPDTSRATRKAAPSALALGLLLGAAAPAAALDIQALWDFRQPALSEQRFRDALKKLPPASDEALILQTQIARSYGLRRDFDAARRVLREQVEPQLARAGAEPRVRHALELGRSYASATHPPEQRTAESKALAREAFERALRLAREAGLDALAVDAVHMFAFVDEAPADQARWAEQGLAIALASTQPAARQWEASLRNNLGLALHRQQRFDEALAQFRQAVLLREQLGDAGRLRVAHWMVAWTLRSLGRLDEALAIQLRLARENEAAGTPDPYVFEELEALYRAKGDEAEAARHAALRQQAAQPR